MSDLVKVTLAELMTERTFPDEWPGVAPWDRWEQGEP